MGGQKAGGGVKKRNGGSRNRSHTGLLKRLSALVVFGLGYGVVFLYVWLGDVFLLASVSALPDTLTMHVYALLRALKASFQYSCGSKIESPIHGSSRKQDAARVFF